MMSIWVRSLPFSRTLGYSPSSRRRLRLGKGQPLICFLRFGWYDIAGHGRRRTIPQYHSIVLPWCAERQVGTSVSPPCAFSLLATRLTALACALTRIYNSVRHVELRLVQCSPALVTVEELENYVAPKD